MNGRSILELFIANPTVIKNQITGKEINHKLIHMYHNNRGHTIRPIDLLKLA